jgi:hypothetical protein
VLEAFDQANGPQITEQEMEQIANELKAISGGKVQYRKLVVNARNQVPTEGASRIETILKKLA